MVFQAVFIADQARHCGSQVALCQAAEHLPDAKPGCTAPMCSAEAEFLSCRACWREHAQPHGGRAVPWLRTAAVGWVGRCRLQAYARAARM